MLVVGKKKDAYMKLVLLILYWVVLQDFVLALLYKITGVTFLVNILFYAKDVLFVCLLIYAVLKSHLPRYMIYAFSGLVMCVAVSSLIAIFKSHIPILQLMQNIRNLLLLPGFIIVGCGIKDKDEFKKSITGRYFPFIVFCAVVGVAEYYLDLLVGTKSFWLNTVGITEFYTDIKGQADRLVFGFPGNFYGDYGAGYFASKRLVGFWMGPLTSAYAMLLPAIYYLVKLSRSKKLLAKDILYFLILCFAIYLSHTRAILLVLLLAVAAVILKKLYAWLKPAAFLGVLICAFVLFVAFIIVFSDKLSAFLYDGSTVGHILSLQAALGNVGLSLFGLGIGTLGINGSIGTESAYFTVFGNLGILGIIFYVIPIIGSLVIIIKNKQRDAFTVTAFLALACYAITGMISEQLFAYTSICPFYVVLGATVAYNPKSNKKPNSVCVGVSKGKETVV